MDTGDDLFTLAEGRVRRDAAMIRVAQAVRPEWWEDAFDAVQWCAEHHAAFTTDAVFSRLAQLGVAPPREPRAMGPLMKAAERAGLVRPTSAFRATTRASRHAAPVRIWRSEVLR